MAKHSGSNPAETATCSTLFRASRWRWVICKIPAAASLLAHCLNRARPVGSHALRNPHGFLCARFGVRKEDVNDDVPERTDEPDEEVRRYSQRPTREVSRMKSHPGIDCTGS